MREPLNNWYVITGGPSSGKTTLLDELEQRGHFVIPEAARTVIDEGIAAGSTIEQIREDEEQFQDTVTRKKIEIEASIDPQQLVFLDRGMHDTEAYFAANGFTLGFWAIDAIRRATYRGVFLLDSLPHYEQDYARTESSEVIKSIHIALAKAYENAGMTLTRVPALSIAERANFVLQHIDQPTTLS